MTLFYNIEGTGRSLRELLCAGRSLRELFCAIVLSMIRKLIGFETFT